VRLLLSKQLRNIWGKKTVDGHCTFIVFPLYAVKYFKLIT